MTIYPNAKINIGLYIGNTLPNGYHKIETIFMPIPLYDKLDITPTNSTTTLDLNGIKLDCSANDNLIMKTYRIMAQEYGLDNVRIELTKHIPFGAGLGGGSSDAAFTAIALNELFDLNLDKQSLASIVATIGADCPFFIYNQPMFAQGIGDQLSPISINLSRYWLLLIKPEINIPTKIAYQEVPLRDLDAQLPTLISEKHITQWKDYITNMFEFSVFKHYPILGEIKQQLYADGAIYASMSGTGSSVYGIFQQQPKPETINKFYKHFTFLRQL